MVVNQLVLNDFRGFKDLDIKLDSKLNVFIGANGAGKTSVLDAISLVLNHYIARFIVDGNNFSIEHGLRADDVNYHATSCRISLSIDIYNQKFNYKIEKNIFETGSSFEGDALGKYLKETRSAMNAETNIPVIIYFNTQKDFNISTDLNEKYLQSRNKHLPQLDAYIDACNKRSYSFKDFSLWWRMEEDKENEIRLRKDPNYRHKQLEAVRSAQQKFLSILKGEVYVGLGIFRVNPSLDKNQNFSVSSEGDLFLKKNDEYIKVSQLSDGEKHLILMVSDIARRLVIANPTRNDIIGTGNGVVLIDEIDQHLHPAWQRTIIAALTETFPEIQFIIATHSPQVLSSVRSENIYSIDNFQAYLVSETYGRDSNEILDLVFEVPESPFKNEISKIYEHISKKEIQIAKELRKELSEKIGDEYSEIQRIDHILERVK